MKCPNCSGSNIGQDYNKLNNEYLKIKINWCFDCLDSFTTAEFILSKNNLTSLADKSDIMEILYMNWIEERSQLAMWRTDQYDHKLVEPQNPDFVKKQTTLNYMKDKKNPPARDE